MWQSLPNMCPNLLFFYREYVHGLGRCSGYTLAVALVGLLYVDIEFSVAAPQVVVERWFPCAYAEVGEI